MAIPASDKSSRPTGIRRHGLRMSETGQNRRFEERRPNGRFLIRKRSFRQAPANDRFWPKVALRRHRKSDRLCDSHEGLESVE